MPITDDNYHAFCSYINIAVCSPVHRANRKHTVGVNTAYCRCVCANVCVSVVEDDDEFINSYSLSAYITAFSYTHTLSLSCDACRIMCDYIFFGFFINFWSIHTRSPVCVSTAHRFGHWLYSLIYLHFAYNNYMFINFEMFCILFFSLSLLSFLSNVNVSKDTFWHAHKLLHDINSMHLPFLNT